VLGVARGELTSEASIRRALDEPEGSPPFRQFNPVDQSGALLPDGGMVSELGKNSFRVMLSPAWPPVPPCTRPGALIRRH